MTLHFVGGATATLAIERETKKHLYVRTENKWNRKYRIVKETGDVQDGTYYNKIKGLFVTEE